jgi:hypothetical protein
MQVREIFPLLLIKNKLKGKNYQVCGEREYCREKSRWWPARKAVSMDHKHQLSIVFEVNPDALNLSSHLRFFMCTGLTFDRKKLILCLIYIKEVKMVNSKLLDQVHYAMSEEIMPVSYLIRQAPWMRSQVSAKSLPIQSSILSRETPVSFILTRCRYLCVVATKVAWLQVRGETDRGSPE